MIKVKTLVFCENVMSTEMFTKCLRPIIQQRLSLRTQHGGGSNRTPTSRFGVRDSTPRPPHPLEYMLKLGHERSLYSSIIRSF